MAKSKNVLKANNSAELLSYIINVTPELKGEINLPVQGESIKPYGKIIMDNERYRNAFIKTVNLIGLTVIKRNAWDNPWDFTTRGTLRFGQQIREIMNDLCNVYDYNSNSNDDDRFLETVVPNVYNYIHELNFQKFYQTTTSDEQMAMAFENDDLFTYIDDAIVMLFESLKYDTYLVDKYQLCRRILEGTVTSIKINDFASKTVRQIVSDMKAVSNKMTFRKPNYNPAGIRKATSFDDQITIVNTDYDAKITTEVLATSYFKNDAEMKTQLRLIDGFDDIDSERLTQLLGDSYVPFTSDEKTALAKIPACIISREWFMDYDYALDNASGQKTTEFYNPVTLKNNHFLHAWRVFSTSPFENAVVFTSDTPAVTEIDVSPSTANVSAGQSLKFSAEVTTTGFANKAVVWSVDSTSKADGVKIDESGLLFVPSDVSVESITVTATSVYSPLVTDTATVTVGSGEPATYTITFNSDGGSAVASQTVLSGGKVVEPKDPTKSDYTFGGWYEDAELTDAYNFSSTVSEDMTLYAKWTAVTPGT